VLLLLPSQDPYSLTERGTELFLTVFAPTVQGGCGGPLKDHAPRTQSWSTDPHMRKVNAHRPALSPTDPRDPKSPPTSKSLTARRRDPGPVAPSALYSGARLRWGRAPAGTPAPGLPAGTPAPGSGGPSGGLAPGPGRSRIGGQVREWPTAPSGPSLVRSRQPRACKSGGPELSTRGVARTGTRLPPRPAGPSTSGLDRPERSRMPCRSAPRDQGQRVPESGLTPSAGAGALSLHRPQGGSPRPGRRARSIGPRRTSSTGPPGERSVSHPPKTSSAVPKLVVKGQGAAAVRDPRSCARGRSCSRTCIWPPTPPRPRPLLNAGLGRDRLLRR